MRKFKSHILFLASDLMRFTGCVHATALELMYLRGEGPKPGVDTEDAMLLQKQGNAHEMAHLENLKDAGRTVMEIDGGCHPGDQHFMLETAP
jgi:uncharacterized protein